MSFDNSTTLEQIGQEAVDALRSDRTDFDDQVCTVVNVDAIRGKLPYLPSSTTFGQDGGALAIGSDPTPIDISQSSVSYECVRYARSIKLDRSEVVDLDQYHNTIGEVAATLMEFNSTARQRDLAALITDSSFVGQHAAGNGNWSVSTSTPVLDMQEAKYNDAPRADTVIMSQKTANELSRHEDITAMSGFGYASGGMIPQSALRQLIAEICGVQNVYIFDAFYNTAGAGEAAALGYVQDEFFGLYEKRGLIKVKQNGVNDLVTVAEKHVCYEWALTDTCDFVTVNDFRLTEVTGI